MRRVNIKDAFVGEPSPGQEGIEADDSDEAVVLSVRGGEVMAVVPSGTPEEGVVSSATTVRGALRLENERVLTFEIHEGANGAFFEDESAQLHHSREQTGSAGLSTLAVGDSDDRNRARKAEEIMTRDVLTASPDMLVEDIAKLLAFHNISGLPVVDGGGKVVGVVSEVDVIGKIGSTVDDIMTHEAITVSKNTPVEQIARLMAERGIKRVPVMDGERLVGLISRADIVRALAARA